MRKIKITLPDKTEIISSFSYKRLPIDEKVITVLSKAWPDRYDESVLVKDTHRWSISLGADAFGTFKELFNAKGIEFVPLLHGEEGDIDFGNVYAIVDTINDYHLAQLLLGIAIFTICTRLLAAKEDFQIDLFLSTIDRQVVQCITHEGYWDKDRLNDLWIIMNFYFKNILQCHFEEFEK